MEKYTHRQQAGKILTQALKKYSGKSNTIILALPRGGVPVAFEIAQALSLPLDIYIVRKLGVPGDEELAMGAIAMDGTIILNDEIIQAAAITKNALEAVINEEQVELARRNLTYRSNRPPPNLTDQTIILVDDGIATGATMRAAIAAIKHQNPKHLVVAVPVAALDTYNDILLSVDELICPLIPQYFYGVGTWYKNFSQTTDAEVLELLAKAKVKH